MVLRFVYFDIPKTVTALLHNISNILLIFGSYSHHCCNNDASTYCSNRFVTIKHNIDVCNIMLLSFVPLLIIHEPLLCAEHHPFLLCSLFPQHPYPSFEKSEIEIVYEKRYTSIVISNKPVDFISFFLFPSQFIVKSVQHPFGIRLNNVCFILSNLKWWPPTSLKISGQSQILRTPEIKRINVGVWICLCGKCAVHFVEAPVIRLLWF